MNFSVLIVGLCMCPLVGEGNYDRPFLYSFHKSLIHVSPEYMIFIVGSHLPQILMSWLSVCCMCPLGEGNYEKPFLYSFHKLLIHVLSPEYIIFIVGSHLP